MINTLGSAQWDLHREKNAKWKRESREKKTLEKLEVDREKEIQELENWRTGETYNHKILEERRDKTEPTHEN